ncbi:MAG: TRC40/GET3/ArsA family transport-energizing ATPase, partial [Myxococcales bacterium]|nr:TRC40/GET3/ArsA family transport-energizing ATPase [Myxococcales bacterium]
EIGVRWEAIRRYLHDFLAAQGVDDLRAEELAIPPGLDELVSLLRLGEIEQAGQHDLVVLDCAPTGGTLRMLGFIDVFEWYMQRVFKLERRFVSAVRPVAERLVHAPLPGDDVYEGIQSMYERMRGVRDLLMDPLRSSVRLVANPERIVLSESQRAFTYLALFGFSVDAVVVNRILPGEVRGGYFQGWKRIQAEHLEALSDAFTPLPVLRGTLYPEELLGVDALEAFGREVFGDRDPSAVLYQGAGLQVRAVGDGFELELPLPNVKKEEVHVLTKGDELIITVGSFRRNLILPRALMGRTVRRARLEDGTFHVQFA